MQPDKVRERATSVRHIFSADLARRKDTERRQQEHQERLRRLLEAGEAAITTVAGLRGSEPGVGTELGTSTGPVVTQNETDDIGEFWVVEELTIEPESKHGALDQAPASIRTRVGMAIPVSEAPPNLNATSTHDQMPAKQIAALTDGTPVYIEWSSEVETVNLSAGLTDVVDRRAEILATYDSIMENITRIGAAAQDPHLNAPFSPPS